MISNILRADLASLSYIRGLVVDGCQVADIDDEICYDINLETGEECATSIQHGNEQLELGSIILSLADKSRLGR